MATKEFVSSDGSDKDLWDDDFDNEVDEDWVKYVRENSDVELVFKHETLPVKKAYIRRRFEPRSL